jgi:hypothetical protein
MSQTLTLTSTAGLPASWSVPVQYSGSSIPQLTISIPPTTTNQHTPFSMPISPAPVMWVMLATGANLTVKTNSSGSPANTFTIVAGTPFLWDGNAAYYSNPVTTAITDLYVTNASGVAATLQIDVVLP